MSEALPPIIHPGAPENYGSWLGSPKQACKICQADFVDKVHRYRYEGVTLRDLERKIRDEFNASFSFSLLSKHFRFHYVINKNVDLAIHGRLQKDQQTTSLDTMLSGMQNSSITFFEAISHMSKARVEQLKRFQELCEEIEIELSERIPPGSDRSGFTNLDRDSDTLIKRWTYLQEIITGIKKEMSKTYIDVQKVIAADDAETIKHHIFMTKTFLLKEFVKNFSNLLNNAVIQGILPEENKVKLGLLIKEMLQKFEGELTIDFLYQQSIEEMKNEKEL